MERAPPSGGRSRSVTLAGAMLFTSHIPASLEPGPAMMLLLL